MDKKKVTRREKTALEKLLFLVKHLNLGDELRDELLTYLKSTARTPTEVSGRRKLRPSH